MLIDVKDYRRSLKALWSDTFGDSDEYINLFFDYDYTPAECFAEIKNGEVISVLYLLKGFIRAYGEEYEGRYLYAAATAESYRGQGIMSKLIKEAQDYAKENKLAFISLLPADEGLYGYYARFGFEAVMRNFTAFVSFADTGDDDEASLSDYLSARESISCPYFDFAANEWSYAFSCLAFAGYSLKKSSDGSFYIVSGDKREILEYIPSEENLKKIISGLSVGAVGAVSAVLPYDLKNYCECRENKYGMVYFADSRMKEKLTDDIYMNIALD